MTINYNVSWCPQNHSVLDYRWITWVKVKGETLCVSVCVLLFFFRFFFLSLYFFSLFSLLFFFCFWLGVSSKYHMVTRNHILTTLPVHALHYFSAHASCLATSIHGAAWPRLTNQPLHQSGRRSKDDIRRFHACHHRRAAVWLRLLEIATKTILIF